MATQSRESRPTSANGHGRSPAAMTLRQLAGQLTSIDPGRYLQLAGEDIAAAVARGEIGGTGLVGDRLGELQAIAVANGHPPLLVKDDGRRGYYQIAPFPLYCFDMDLVRRAHAEAAGDAHLAGVTLIRLTCDYAFAQNQGRTQEGGLISCPVFMSDVTRASTEGLVASGRIAVVLKHMGPYQYTAGPDYTALPIERTEFLETVLPRYAGGFEAGAHGVMMSFVALERRAGARRPLPARPDPGAGRAGGDHRVRLRRHLRALRRLRLRREPEGGGAPRLPRGRDPHRPVLAALPHPPAGARRGGADRRGGAPRPRGRDPRAQGPRRRARRPDARHRARPRAEAPRPAGTGLPRAGAGLGGAAPAEDARPGRAPDPDRGRRPPLRARTARRPGPGGLARRLLEPRQPPPRAGDHAARRHPPALAGGDLRPRLRLRRRDAEARDRRGGGARRGGDARRRLPRRAARMERRVGDAGGAAPALRPAPAGRGGARGRTRRRRSSSSSPPAGRCTSRARSRRPPTPSSGRRTPAASPARRSPTSSPGSPTRAAASPTGCPSPTGSPRASTPGRRGPTAPRSRSSPARRRGGSATTGAPTTSASGRAGRRPTPSARAIPTRPSPSRTARSTAGGCRSRKARRSRRARG